VCGKQFQNHRRNNRLEKTIWKQYVYQRQTIRQLAVKYKRGKNWIRAHLFNVPVKEQRHIPQSIVAIADVTFSKRDFGVCMIRAPHLKKNIYAQEVQTESVDAYEQGGINLAKRGYTIKAIVLDGRPGVRQLFWDVPIQMCHFHQKQIITRYLTNNPKLEASLEFKKITDALCKTNERDFTAAINHWHQKWSFFLKERTTDLLTGGSTRTKDFAPLIEA